MHRGEQVPPCPCLRMPAGLSFSLRLFAENGSIDIFTPPKMGNFAPAHCTHLRSNEWGPAVSRSTQLLLLAITSVHVFLYESRGTVKTALKIHDNCWFTSRHRSSLSVNCYVSESLNFNLEWQQVPVCYYTTIIKISIFLVSRSHTDCFFRAADGCQRISFVRHDIWNLLPDNPDISGFTLSLKIESAHFLSRNAQHIV